MKPRRYQRGDLLREEGTYKGKNRNIIVSIIVNKGSALHLLRNKNRRKIIKRGQKVLIDQTSQ